MPDILLGIDIGTSSVKASLVRAEDAALLATAQEEYPTFQPQPGYAEQEAAYWWRAASMTIRAALAQAEISPQRIAGIGLSGQMHGVICLDREMQPLRPAIIWADSRSKPQVDSLQERFSPAEMAPHAPGPPAVGFMGPTLMWLAEHEPQTLARTQTVLLPKDWLRLRLTGQAGTDPSDAAATWLYDVRAGQWSDWLVNACGLETRYLPQISESQAVVGRVSTQAAQELKLPAGIPVVTGCADQAAQALGYGLIEPGRILVTIGTGGQVFMPLTHAVGDPQMRYYVYNHALAGRWYAAAAILTGGLALRWLRDLLGLKDRPDAYAYLSELAAGVPPGAQGLVFLPHLAGERTPYMDPQASGVFLGLRLHHQAGHLARAVMEGVSFLMRDCLDLVSEGCDGPLQIIASGGAATSALWRQIQADVYQEPLYLAQGENHACLGAALLAGVGSGLYSNLAEAIRLLPAPVPAVEPNPANAAFYAERRDLYSGLYVRLKDDMHRLSAGL